jgi:hypothetical protein
MKMLTAVQMAVTVAVVQIFAIVMDALTTKNFCKNNARI